MRARDAAHGSVHTSTGVVGTRPPRVFDPRVGMFAVRLLPGSYTTGAADETIVTVLGSCVAACIRNPFSGFGGMNHFMLPESETGEWSGASAALRYGNYAMELLINEALKSGCGRGDLEIKVFGGANLTDGFSQVGSKNAQFAVDYLDAEGLSAVSSDLGGNQPRVVRYVPGTGTARRILLKRPEAGDIMERERQYKVTLTTKPTEGDIELFD